MARVLITDDNDSIRELMRSYLEQSGHVICGEAHDGVQAIAVAKQTQPDVILLDLTMPGMNGIETGSLLKRTMADTPIILFTLHEDVVNKELAAIMGVDLVVEKVKGIKNLAESIKTVLSQRVKTSRRQLDDSESSSASSDDKNVEGVPPKPD
jgi:DNA-binding response OmpR family regulator